VTHCRGCGGHIGSAPPTYGHILGCGHGLSDDAGAHEHHGDNHSHWEKKQQEKVLGTAFKEAAKKSANIKVLSAKELEIFALELRAAILKHQ